LFFSGFSLNNEQNLFKDYIETSDFVVSGFSYGAIKAIDYTLNAIKNNIRIDKIQLFSPAYFNDQNKKFKRMQLIFFQKNQSSYKDNFLNNIQYPNKIDLAPYVVNGSYEQLDLLLNYQWQTDILQTIVDANIIIEVYLGEKDKIINSLAAKDFFRAFAEVYFIKNVGHILQ